MAVLYSFVNSYLSDIQRGLQTAHLVNEFWLNYGFCSDCPEQELFVSWAYLGKTIRALNGHTYEDLRKLNLMFFKNPNHYPFAHFREDRKSLNEVMTAVGIILPEIFTDRCDRDKMIERATMSMREPCQDFDAEMAQLLIDSRAA
jgi:hypothetical protein